MRTRSWSYLAASVGAWMTTATGCAGDDAAARASGVASATSATGGLDDSTGAGAMDDDGTGGSTSGVSDGADGDPTGTGSSDDGDGPGSSESESSGGAEACGVVGVDGVCGDAASCDRQSTAFGGLCDDVPSVQCCVPSTPPCSVSGAPGLCLDVDACAETSTPGLCPGDATIQCCTDPATACDPDAMPLPNEGLTEQSWDPACPDGMVASDGFCIDRYEAFLVELDDSGAVLGSWSPYFSPGSTRVRAVSALGAVPQGHISQLQAGAACTEAGKRLCTDTEWLRACQGADGNTYPYGQALQPGRCNDARGTHPAIEYFGSSEPWVFNELGHPCISQIPASLDVTGLNEGCESADGALDMMGNLHEWTADPTGVFRGGFFVDTSNNGDGCNYDTTAHDVSYGDYSTGFRCCADL